MKLTFFACRSSMMSKLGLYSAVLFFPAVAVLLLIASLFVGFELCINSGYTFLQVFISLLMMVLAIIIASFLLVVSQWCYLMETRQISIDSYGFAVRNKSERRYAWNEIGGIGIVAYAASASKLNYQTQICIFLEPISDEALKHLRDSYLYGAFKRYKYVLIDYNEIILNRIAMQSQVQIDDLRPHQMKL